MKTLQVHTFGLSLAILGALSMLVMALLALAGYYTAFWEAMVQWHYLAGLTFGGILGGMVEAAVWSYIGGVVFAWTYNRLA